MNRSTGVVVLLALFLWVAVAPRQASGQDDPFPLRGAVASKTHAGLAVREAPPEVTAFSYKLGKRICGIANGSAFTAFDRHLVANGEIWYQVEITKVTRALGGTPCPAVPFSGWMVAQAKSGLAVEVLERNVEVPERQVSAQASAVDDDSTEPEIDPSTVVFLAKYLFLLFGTALGVAVVAIEKARKVRPAEWLTELVWVELCVLSIANVLFVVLLVDTKYSASDTAALATGGTSPLFALVKLLEAAAGGYVVLGFVLTVVWMKFMSFAEGH